MIGDFFRRGRRLRPATLEFAIQNFPVLILRLKQNRLIVTSDDSVGNASVVVLKGKVAHEQWAILRSDFDICKKIAGNTALHIFPGDTDRIILDRIEAHIMVEFAGRGIPAGNV